MLAVSLLKELETSSSKLLWPASPSYQSVVSKLFQTMEPKKKSQKPLLRDKAVRIEKLLYLKAFFFGLSSLKEVCN